MSCRSVAQTRCREVPAAADNPSEGPNRSCLRTHTWPDTSNPLALPALAQGTHRCAPCCPAAAVLQSAVPWCTLQHPRYNSVIHLNYCCAHFAELATPRVIRLKLDTLNTAADPRYRIVD